MSSFIPTIILIMIIEQFLSGLWVPAYFRYGIPLFRRSFSDFGRPPFEIEADTLTKKVGHTFWLTSVFFNSLGPGEIAFRQAKFTLYTPVMHGIIRHNRNDGVVTITGYANWFLGLLAILMLVQFGSRIMNIRVVP